MSISTTKSHIEMNLGTKAISLNLLNHASVLEILH